MLEIGDHSDDPNYFSKENLSYFSKHFKIGSSQSSLLNMNDFRHFILNRNQVLGPEEVKSVACKVFHSEDYKIKRIVKPLFKYVRISILKCVPEDVILNGIRKVATELRATPREQSLKRRIDLESASTSVKKQLGHVMTLNINGIKGKYYELLMLLEKHRPDIICLQETKLKVLDRRVHINGYIVHEVPSGEKGRGLLMGFRKDSHIDFKIIESSPDCIIASVNGSSIIGNIYRSPHSAEGKATTLKVANLLKKHADNTQCLLVGDWNNTPEVIKKKLLSLGVQTFSTGAPSNGTRVSPSRRRTRRPIDYGLSNDDRLIVSQNTRFNWMISDHLPVQVWICLRRIEECVEMTTVFDRERLREPSIINAIKNHEFSLESYDPVEDVRVFHEELNKTLRELKVIREVEASEHTLRIPNSIKRAIKLKRVKDKQVQSGIAAISELLEAKREVSKQIRAYKRKSYLRFVSKGIKYLRENDARNAWKWVKTHSGIGKNKIGVDQVYKPGTQEAEQDPRKRLSIWAEHFRKLSIAGPKGSEDISSGGSYPTAISEITDSEVSWTEIQAVLKSMRKGKAAGSDMIPGEVYKLVECETTPSSQFSRSILRVLNNIYRGEGFPLEWRDCTVVPIFKKGDRLDPNNYRGIALINTLLKVLTKVIATRLQNVCCDFKLIRKEQVGFIRSEECVAQVACLLESCQRRKIQGKDTLLCFLDLRKAYDMVPHERLISKLVQIGIGHRMINFVKRMYENTFMRIRIGKNLTEPFRYERGVRQGCPTSPLLFDIYINDILNSINPVEVPGLQNGLRGLMFADDTVILADSILDLTTKLCSIDRWMIDNAMEINPSKCGIMVIRSDPLNLEPIAPIAYNGENIPMVDKYVYLGIEFNNMLNIDLMSKHRIDKGKQTVGMLVKQLANNRMPLGYRLMLVKSIVIPTIHYGSEIFGMCEVRVNSLKRILDNSIKPIVKKSNFCRLRAYSEFDIKPIYVSGAVARARGLQKWANSHGLISELISSAARFKSRKSTWIKEAKRWLSFMKIDINQPARELLKQVADNRTARLHERDRSVIGEFADRYSINSGKPIIKAEIKEDSDRIGVNGLIRIRTGTFPFTKDLVRNLTLPTRYRSGCVCCENSTSENIEHLILECEAFNDIRESIFPNLRQQLRNISEVNKNILLKKLLGGEKDLTSGRKISREVLKSIKYLSKVLPMRSALIADRRSP